MHQKALFFVLINMKRRFEKVAKEAKPINPPPELFDRIILAIKTEQEIQIAQKLLFDFLFLFSVSIMFLPFSWSVLINQLEKSGTISLFSVLVSDFGIFLTFWKDFSLAILEVLPVTEIIFFSISLGISIFTLRLFLKNKNLIFKGLTNNLGAI